ncbi:MAG: hypothetical protein KL787_00415 [Taibaiella sp.]|nr:hypothetical protein [Taibaiella sp.]
MKYLISLISFASCFLLNAAHSQNTYQDSVRSFSGLAFDIGLWEGYRFKNLSDEFKRAGIQTNPGISVFTEVKETACEDCSSDQVVMVYYEIFEHREMQHADGGIMIVQYKDVAVLEKQLPKLEVLDEDIYLKKDNYLIYIWNHEEDHEERQKLLAIAKDYYEEKGAAYFQARRKKDLTLEELGQWLAENDTAADKEITGTEDRKIKHIFYSENAFIVFYNDGTVRICPDCELNQANILTVGKEPAYSIYMESSTGIVIHSKLGELEEPVIIDYDAPAEIGKWAMLHFKETETIPAH